MAMAVFDEMIVPKNSGNDQDSGASPLRGGSVENYGFASTRQQRQRQQQQHQTPIPVSGSGRPPRSSARSKQQLHTAATPETVAMTPETTSAYTTAMDPSFLDSDVPKHLICTIQQPVSHQQDGSTSSTSSTSPTWPLEDDSEKSSTPQNATFERHEPSLSGGGRTLFHLSEACEPNSSFEDDVDDFYLQQSPPVSKRRDPRDGGSKRSTKSESSRFRARRQSQSSCESLTKISNASSRRRHIARSRSMGEGNEFQLNAVTRNSSKEQASSDDDEHDGDDEDYGAFVLRNDSSISPFRPNTAATPWHNDGRRRNNLGRRKFDSSDAPILSKLLPRRITCMVWLLCIVGLTSMCMVIVLHNSNKDLERMEQRDHIAILFRNDKPNAHTGTSTSTLRGGQPPMQEDSGSEPLVRPSSKFHRSVDLHHLAQVSVADGKASESEAVVAEPKKKAEKKKKEDDKKKKQKDKVRKGDKKKRKDAEPKYGATKDISKRKKTAVLEEGSKNSPHYSAEKHHHHTSKHEEHPREYVRARPVLVGLPNIPQVFFPSPLDLRGEQLEFDVVDQNLFDTRGSESGTSNARVLVLDGSSVESWEPSHREIELYPAEFTDNTQLYSVLDSSDERVGKTMEMREPFGAKECVPMQEWQTTFNPSCNGMHELDMPGMGDRRTEDDITLFGMKGFWRNAWKYDSIGGHSKVDERDTVVLKTLRINHRFEDAFYENNRIDAVVLERLTASPHVINVFGFCGHSVLTEFADGKRLGELADKMKKVPLARLSIARDIASGLADVHGIDGDDNATFVHLDINPANVVSIGGTLKLNDFNIGVLRQWNTTSNEPCGIPAQYPNPQWRSPEEARQEKNLTEKVDVFSLGHILFRLICGHEPWHKLEPGGMPSKQELNEKVKQGIRPTIPDSVLKSTDPEIAAIRDAMFRCYTYDPTKRPSAREIAASLSDALENLETDAQAEQR